LASKLFKIFIMKKLLLSLLILGGLNATAQVSIYDDSFEFYEDFAFENIGDWTTVDLDLLPTYGFTGVTFLNSGIAKSFQVFNATTTVPALTASATADWTAKTGDRHMVCFASVPTGAVTANNDWLISPQITLGNSNTVKFWAKACDATYFQERFSVWVSTSGTAPADFVKISAGNFITTPNITWVEYTYNLAASYDGLPVYIGIKCISPDMFGFAIDDFSVTAATLGTEGFFASNYAVYPNPANNVLNINSKNTSVFEQVQLTDVNGRIVKSEKTSGVITYQMNIADLNAGVYFLKVTSNQGSSSTKIIKK
jgi:hypothetical protein